MFLANLINQLHLLQKGNMMLLSKEATAKDKNLKTQLLFKIWKRPGVFGDRKRDFSISKADSPENTLCYANQGTISTGIGDFEIHLDYVILKQLIPAKNKPENARRMK